MATMNLLKNVKGETAINVAKEIVNTNIANAEEKENTMATKKEIEKTIEQEVITVTINTNTEKQGYEIRFSGTPKASVKNMLVSLKFRFYPALANAWIKKTAKVSDDELKKFIKACEKSGYIVKRTVDGKTEETVKAETDDMTAQMVAFLKANGYNVSKKRTPKAKAETEPKKEPKLEAKSEIVSNNTKKPKTKTKLTADGKEITRKSSKTEKTDEFPF